MYTHLVIITKFCVSQRGLNEHQSLQKAKVTARSFSSEMEEVANSAVKTCPETLIHQVKRVLISILHAA